MQIDECRDGKPHEFEFYEKWYDERGGEALVAVAECVRCPLEIGPEQMKRLLNAAVKLPPDVAEEMASGIAQHYPGYYASDAERKESWPKLLRGFASARRGETDEQ